MLGCDLAVERPSLEAFRVGGSRIVIAIHPGRQAKGGAVIDATTLRLDFPRLDAALVVKAERIDRLGGRQPLMLQWSERGASLGVPVRAAEADAPSPLQSFFVAIELRMR